jgi:hypothetical protein
MMHVVGLEFVPTISFLVGGVIGYMQTGVEVEGRSGRRSSLAGESAIGGVVDLEGEVRKGEETAIVVCYKSTTRGNAAKNSRREEDSREIRYIESVGKR